MLPKPFNVEEEELLKNTIFSGIDIFYLTHIVEILTELTTDLPRLNTSVSLLSNVISFPSDQFSHLSAKEVDDKFDKLRGPLRKLKERAMGKHKGRSVLNTTVDYTITSLDLKLELIRNSCFEKKLSVDSPKKQQHIDSYLYRKVKSPNK